MQFRLFALLRIYLIAGLEQLIMELNVIGKYIYFNVYGDSEWLQLLMSFSASYIKFTKSRG